MSDPAGAPPGHRFEPRWAWVGWTAGAGLVLAVLAATGDAVGGVLAGAAALGALGVAGYDALVRPALVADPVGITVRTGWQPRHYAWADLTRVEVTTTRRLVVNRALEIDAGEDLVLLGRRRLGAELSHVVAVLAAYGAPVVGEPSAPGDPPEPGRDVLRPGRDVLHPGRDVLRPGPDSPPPAGPPA